MTNLIGQSLGRYHILEQLGDDGDMPSTNKAANKRTLGAGVRVFVNIRGWFVRPI